MADKLLGRLRVCGVSSRQVFLKINPVRQFAEAEEVVFYRIIANDYDAQAGFVAERHADGAGGHGFDVAIAGDSVAMVMAGEEIFDAEFMEEGEI